MTTVQAAMRAGTQRALREAMTRAHAAFLALHALTLLAVALQLVIDPGYTNLLAMLCVTVSSTVTFAYVERTRALHEVPLSTVAVLGLCMTTQWGALVGQTLFWSSLTEHLRVPLTTFSHLLGYQLVALGAHWLSRRLMAFTAARAVLANRLLAPLGVFKVPAVESVWVIGVVGLLSVLAAGSSEGGLGGKVAGGFGVLAWAPFAIPLLHVCYGDAYCAMRRQWLALGLFACAAVLLGLALNFRVVMFTGAITAALLTALWLFTDDRPVEARHLRRVGLAVVALAALAQPLGYFATAVQVAREMRGRISQVEMIRHTFYTLLDTAAVSRAKDSAVVDAELSVYDETYFKSPLVARLVETKFHDNGFFLVDGVRPEEAALIADDVVDRVWSFLPYPVLKWLGKERSKLVTLYSAGDYLAWMRYGLELGGFKTGSAFAQGEAVAGPWAPLLYGLICLPVFVAWDMLARPRSAGQPVLAGLSLVGMVLVYRLFTYGAVSESLSGFAGLLLRNQLQTLLLFTLLAGALRLVWPAFDPDARPRQRADRGWVRVMGQPLR